MTGLVKQAIERIENREALVEIFWARGVQLQPYDGGGKQALGLRFLSLASFVEAVRMA